MATFVPSKNSSTKPSAAQKRGSSENSSQPNKRRSSRDTGALALQPSTPSSSVAGSSLIKSPDSVIDSPESEETQSILNDKSGDGAAIAEPKGLPPIVEPSSSPGVSLANVKTSYNQTEERTRLNPRMLKEEAGIPKRRLAPKANFPRVSQNMQGYASVNTEVPGPHLQYNQRLENLLDRCPSELRRNTLRTPPQIMSRGTKATIPKHQCLPHIQTSSIPPLRPNNVTQTSMALQSMTFLESPVPRGPECFTHAIARHILCTIGPCLTEREKDTLGIPEKMTAIARDMIRLRYKRRPPTSYDYRAQMQIAYFWAMMYNTVSFDDMGSRLFLERVYFESIVSRFSGLTY